VRTIKVTAVLDKLPGSTLEVETEEIIEDDADARDAGRRGAHVINDFLAGYVDGLDERE
jgi:hypothetical protein